MPQGSVGGRKTVVIRGAGSAEFGDIEFAKPGTYAYTVTETFGSAACSYDRSAYTITYVVMDDGTGKLLPPTRTVTVTRNGVEQSVDLGPDGNGVGAVFTNVYPDEPAAERIPRTGDVSQAAPLAAFALALVAGGAALRRRG
ncbi:Spy0128 family protein [Olsenella urininfantis]|uniref:Spy0128 family protein n=1 Tax=Olsenella urininfantis TaxID=1871033 RepID=UPI0009876FC3|nr:FctA domain-containing protein [Olsenella urininfantis]